MSSAIAVLGESSLGELDGWWRFVTCDNIVVGLVCWADKLLLDDVIVLIAAVCIQRCIGADIARVVRKRRKYGVGCFYVAFDAAAKSGTLL